MLALLLRCPGPELLEFFAHTSEEAEHGIDDHAKVLPALAGGSLPSTPRGRRLREVEIPISTRVEVALAVDPVAGQARILAPKHSRDYRGVRDGEIPGTADLWAAGWVLDFKSGSLPVPRARRNLQMRFFALAQWLYFGERPTVVVAQVDEDGYGPISEHMPSENELEQFRGRLARLQEHIAQQMEVAAAGGRLALVRGPHCANCDAIAVCPAITEALGDGTSGDRWLAARALLARATSIEALARDLLVRDEEPVTGGDSLMRTEKHRRRIDPAAALNEIPELYAVARYRISIGDIEKWAGQGVAHGRKGYARRAVIERLTAVGAVHRTTSVEYREAKDE